MIATDRRHSPRHIGSRRAFTLVEVMISVALVLILIIGINQAFKMVTDTVGAGQTLSAIVRDNRAIQPVIYGDLRGAVTQNAPAFIIASSRVSAFRNRADEQSDLDFAGGGGEPSIRSLDFDNDNTEGEAAIPGEVIHPATYNYRSHRTDRLAFFARDTYRRQTGNDGQYTSTLTGGEAYIWYGHLRLKNNMGDPGDDASYIRPGTGDFATNPNNFHAANFALGRMVMLLLPNESTTAGSSLITDKSTGTPVPQHHIRRLDSSASPDVRLTPLTFGSPATVAGFPVHTSRFDLAATTIAEFYTDVLAVSGQPFATPPLATVEDYWWTRLLYRPASGTTYAAPASGAPVPRDFDYRFAANRFFARPLDAEKAAKIAPILASGCSQFIVEFAGDYITQTQAPNMATDGTITNAIPDGVLDFVVDNYNGAFERRTRWYGLPRDTAGNMTTNAAGAVVGGPDNAIPVAGTGANMAGPDVLPVRDVRGQSAAPFPAPAGYVSFERNIANDLPPPTGGKYMDPVDPAATMDPDARYTCVWGPDINPETDPLPQMLRITIVLDEPAGRLAEGQTYEYVVNLP